MSVSDDTPLTALQLRSRGGSLSREQVEDIQRARVVRAMIEVAAEQGYVGAAIAPVLARAGVSRRTFYELFEGREDCFLAAFEWGLEQGRQVMVTAHSSQRSWRERMRHAVAALLVLLDSEPELARACVIEALGAGKLVLARRAQAMEALIAVLDTTAPRAPGAVAPLLLTAEGVIGGAFSVVHARLLEQHIDAAAHSAQPRSDGASRSSAPLIELHGQLMALIALPYLGPRVAGEELMRSAPSRPGARPRGRVTGDPGVLRAFADLVSHQKSPSS